ncbi:HlyD family secretion protein [Verticiella sediminum]|uniref:HlyD family secretion protein n=1 Tax=Verticiella sediminum TaxID=1247510 RepID=A0A556AWV1_9BURK|nr:HlyD family secretion protein [Verticiella sediminum]TSH97404.1 HlyD family secretion protein [Verticiella sediminum]
MSTTPATAAAVPPERPGDAPERAQPPAPEPIPKILKPHPRTVIVMALVALAGVLAILYAWQLWPFVSDVVSTDNAYVRGQITVLAPQVNGYVGEVAVQDFAQVRANDVLVRIDERIYRQRVAQAEAQVAAAHAGLDNVAQSLASGKATLASRQAELSSAQAEYQRARADEARVNELASRGSVSNRERDQIRAAARAAAAHVKQAEAAIDIARQDIAATEVSRGGREADVELAEATLRLARIDLDNTVIRAPRDGQVGEVGVRQGQYVAAGTQLVYLVPRQTWIVANYKETQTYAMRHGQPVRFAVDGLPGDTFRGCVERISPATGSEFSLLRPDNATGNFTKVVQRIPVRIAIDPDQPDVERLRPGMSVVTRVDTSVREPAGECGS